jgi:hypothetical protein
VTYKVEVEYLEHDGGTKFYETVLIKEHSGPGILIKRYGSIDKKMGGGQTLIERGSHIAVDQAARKILTEKRKRSSKGQYVNVAHLNFGLHPLHNVFNVGADELAQRVWDHYNRTDSDTIQSYFGFSASGAGVVKEEPASAEPEEPIIRDAHWGSW